MPFSFSEAPPNFQKAIEIILKPNLGRYVSVYMDDVIISSPLFTHSVKHLKEVFKLLQEAGLTFNKDKCHFASEKLKYLGLVISKEGIRTDGTKVNAITQMKPPKNAREIATFLGMIGWYQKFIKNYTDLCEPLYRLKGKSVKFIWSNDEQTAFEN
ncbi:retrovirus-related Pol polyprotein from transposon opus [Trichonephila clavipes]|nr:retrovirus-related Pol polyprotein from transposon opus [Trichonephila clavipes]